MLNLRCAESGRISLFIFALCLMLPSVTFAQAGDSTSQVVPAHAHNDYYHLRPLLDAVDHNFESVEVDVFLEDGELLVGHDAWELTPERTLESLYLKPLRKIVRERGGHVYPDRPLMLLIDVKTEAESTYEHLREVLSEYSDILTEFGSDYREDRAVLAVVSGNRAIDRIAAEEVRYVAVDGRPIDLETNPPVELVPLISTNWWNHFEWLGAGSMPDHELAELREMVRTAHEQGRMIRFWAHPDHRVLWGKLVEEGVDLINTDNICGVYAYFVQEIFEN